MKLIINGKSYQGYIQEIILIKNEYFVRTIKDDGLNIICFNRTYIGENASCGSGISIYEDKFTDDKFLSKIIFFYNILAQVYIGYYYRSNHSIKDIYILYTLKYHFGIGYSELFGGGNMNDIVNILNLDEDNSNKDEVTCYLGYTDECHPDEIEYISEENRRIIEIISLKEFHLLMKIFFGIYDDKNYIDSLIEKEKDGEFEGLEKDIKEDFKNTYHDLYPKGIYDQYTLVIQKGKILNSEKTREYLLLELYKKDTKGAFDDIEIKKVYDDNWSEKEKFEAIAKINESFGSEMFVFDKSPNI